MATCPVRFEFHCERAPAKLKYIHNIPRSLVTADAQAAQEDAGYINRFVDALRPIMKEHEAACRAASNTLCGNCGSPTVTVLQTPMSWVHIVEDPFVAIWANPVCGKGQCEIQIRKQVEDMMSVVVREGQGRGASESSASMEIMSCKICGKTEATNRCGRCKVVAYCGKEHQKADWKVHRKICVSKDGKATEEGLDPRPLVLCQDLPFVALRLSDVKVEDYVSFSLSVVLG
ncbi:hypothetical protein EDB81DRAFT_927018 [Dactylonectria macrodidyma]|uniref:MYND-type domain-containing protein n=1 Tax=Dactylonectria macrodidyma TaxID=307937 RepID=A0A9P9D0I9_9HYPO|nr:hypothetical protein EDB81DRAFT_927018 [Dactylonectria macrodidyma]